MAESAIRIDRGELIRLQTYVDVLSEAAGGEIPGLKHWARGSVTHRAARELLRSGLLSDARVEIGTGTSIRGMAFTENIVLSPEGALALIQWRDYIRDTSLRMRLWRGLYQWLLVLIGAVAGGVAGVVATRLWPPG